MSAPTLHDRPLQRSGGSQPGDAGANSRRVSIPDCRWPRCPEPAGIRGYCLVHAEKILDERLDQDDDL